MVMQGYILVLPFSYFWRALSTTSWGSSVYRETREAIGWGEIGVRLAVMLGLNELLISMLPYKLFGTKNLPVATDFLFKRVSGALLMMSLAQSPFDSFLTGCFRQT